MNPDFEKIKALSQGLAVFVTAPSSNPAFDFVDRTFWPKLNVNEDPVCGSAHCSLTPYWSEKLNKKTLIANQVSKRGGILYLQDCGERIKISGYAVKYAESEIEI